MVQFVMPKLGADMTGGKLVEWCKKPGEHVKRGDIIAVIETDKANVDTESFVDGVLESILVEPHDEWLPVGTPLAVIHVEGEAPPSSRPAPPPAAAPARSPPSAQGPGDASGDRGGGDGAAQDFARRAQARARTRDRSSATRRHRSGRTHHAGGRGAGRGRTGRAGPGSEAAEAPDRAQRMRDAIATTMARSKREIPHYYLATTIALANALAWLEARNEERPVTERLLSGVLLIKATALALREVPELNGFWRDGRAEQSRAIHLGVAISLRGGGLVAPALHDADKQSLDELMGGLQDLTKRARAGRSRARR